MRRARGWLALAAAVCAGPAFARCEERLNLSSLAVFLQAPGELLDAYPLGGDALARAAQVYVVAGPAPRGALLGLVARANARQRQAVARGFAFAYAACRFERPAIGREVDRLARGVADDAFARAYSGLPGESAAPATPAGDKRARLSARLNDPTGVRDPAAPLPLPGSSRLDP